MPSSPLDAVWRLLLALAARRRFPCWPLVETGFRLTGDGQLASVPCGNARDVARAQLVRHADGHVVPGEALTAAEHEFVEPYLPLLSAGPGRPVVVAHLGQSVDGCIATASGDSAVVTGREDFVHMHRLRALADAVVVGGGTVAADDPRLTTRLVDGPDPVRVIIDPTGRLPPDRGVFVDGLAPTLHVLGTPSGQRAEERGAGVSERGEAAAPSEATPCERLYVPAAPSGLSLPALLATLQARGLHAIFVEGGGVTVTRWIEAGLVTRLHLAVAPVLVGVGRPALQLPGAARMRDSLRPPCRLYRLGQDILWDFDLRAGGSSTDEGERHDDLTEGGDDRSPRRLS